MNIITQNSIIKGLVISSSDDLGPKVNVNLSDLNETSSLKLSLLGMTILMFGNEHPSYFDDRFYKVYGPIPVPHACVVTTCPENFIESSNLDTLAIIFHVEDDLPTKDERYKRFGRDIIAWIIFKSVDRVQIFKNIKIIEGISESYLKEITHMSELNNRKYFTHLFEDLKSSVLEEFVNGTC